MKKRIIIILTFVVLIIFSIILMGISKKKEKYDFYINTIETPNCSGVSELIYENGERDLYAYCLDEIKVIKENDNCSDNNCSKTLKELLTNQGNTIINSIYDYMDNLEILNDGGTKVYTSYKESKFTNNGLKIISCNTIDGNKDIYIGPLSMDQEICTQ